MRAGPDGYVIEHMRRRTYMLTGTGVDLKKIADAAAPLYAAVPLANYASCGRVSITLGGLE